MIRVAIAGCGIVTRLCLGPVLSRFGSKGWLRVAAACDPDLHTTRTALPWLE